MSHRIRAHLRSNIVGYLALFFALTGSAVALDGTNTVFSDDIVNGQVQQPDIASQAVGTDQIKNNQVRSPDIKNGEVMTDDVADGAVTGSKLGANSVDGGKVADSSLTGDDVNSESLTGFDIADQTVTGDDLQNQTVEVQDVDLSSLNLVTATATGSCNDDQGTGTSCVSTTLTTGSIGPITIHVTGTWDTFAFDDGSGANAGSDNPNIVQGRCNIRFDGTQVGPVQSLGEADVSGTGSPTHPSGLEGTLALTARTIPLGSGSHTVDLFCTEIDGDIDFHNLDITAQGSVN